MASEIKLLFQFNKLVLKWDVFWKFNTIYEAFQSSRKQLNVLRFFTFLGSELFNDEL